jgi:hypothetical protein
MADLDFIGDSTFATSSTDFSLCSFDFCRQRHKLKLISFGVCPFDGRPTLRA